MNAEEFLVAEIQNLREENATLKATIEKLEEKQRIQFSFDIINNLGSGEWRIVLKDGIITVETENAKEKNNGK